MNRLSLLREAWTILKRNPILWSIPLLTLTIDTLANWVVLLLPPETTIVRVLLAFVLAAFTTGVLITSVNAIADGQPVTLFGGLRAGLRRLLPLFLLNLLLSLPVWLVIVGLSGSITAIFTSGLGQPGALQATNVLSVIVSLGLASVVLAVNAATNLIGIGAERVLLQDDLTVIASVKSGGLLLLRQSRDYISIAIMLIGVVLGVGLAFAFILGPLLSGLATGFSETPEAVPPAALFSPVNVLFILISLIVNSLYTTFASTVWTLAYREWRGAPET